jgi:4-amino-4-deoxy-L-arabinose transferase-like glycosyltransferase
MKRGGRRGRIVWHALAAVVLALYAVVLASSARAESPTVDEPLHLTRGLAWLWTGDTRLSYAHPPLGNVIAALPSATVRDFDFRKEARLFREAEPGELASAFIAADYPAFRARLDDGRLAMIALAALFGAYLYAFVLRLSGPRTALFALFLFAVHPTIAAHARLVTTDAPAAFFAFVALGEFIRYLERPRAGSRLVDGARAAVPLVTTAIATGAAVSTKYSALYLVPFLLVVGAWSALLGRGRFAGFGAARRLATFAAHAAFVSALVVGATYRFQREDMTVAEILAAPEPENPVTRPFHGELLERTTPLPRLPQDLRVPLPYSYVFGVATVGAFAASGRSSYFMGQRTSSVPFYFPVLLVLKQPLVLVLLLAMGARERRLGLTSRASRVLVGAAAMFLFFAMVSRLNLGVRHVLPMMPILVVLAARQARRVAVSRAFAPRRFALVVALSVAAVAGFAAAYPHLLGYFNVLAIDARIAHKISVVGEDWGQDAGEAARYAKAHGMTPLYYGAYGRASAAEVEREGLTITAPNCTSPPRRAAWIMLHAANVVRSPCYRWLGLPEREPDARVNEHVYFYRYDPNTPPNLPGDGDDETDPADVDPADAP